MSFKTLGLSEQILKTIEEVGYETPSQIQKKAIPQVLMGRDILGCAQTGTVRGGTPPTVPRFRITHGTTRRGPGPDRVPGQGRRRIRGGGQHRYKKSHTISKGDT